MNFSFITPNLWVGPCPDEVADFEALKSREISAILSLQSPEDLEHDIGWEPAAAAAAGLIYRNVPVTDFDSRDLRMYLPHCVQVLDEMVQAGHRVYLHCTAGVNRSPTVAAAYLHWCLNWPLERALDHLREARECVPLGDVIRSAKKP